MIRRSRVLKVLLIFFLFKVHSHTSITFQPNSDANAFEKFKTLVIAGIANYENKKILKPVKWTQSLNNYSASIEGVTFENLSYDQFLIISKYSDDI